MLYYSRHGLICMMFWGFGTNLATSAVNDKQKNYFVFKCELVIATILLVHFRYMSSALCTLPVFSFGECVSAIKTIAHVGFWLYFITL